MGLSGIKFVEKSVGRLECLTENVDRQMSEGRWVS